MGANEFDTDDILAGVEWLLADGPDSDVEDHAERLLLLWEVEGVFKIIAAGKPQGHNAALAMQQVRRLIFRLYAMTDTGGGDEAMELARKKLATMPLDFRLQSILYHLHGRMFVKGDFFALRALGYMADGEEAQP